MVIGIDASRANKEKRTGVEWYSYFLIQEFKRIVPANVKVRLYSPAPLLPDLLPLPDNWEVRVLHWPFKKFWTIKRLSLEMLLHKPDVLFVPSHILPSFCPKNTYTAIHDVAFKEFPENYSWVQRFVLNLGLNRALSHAKTIFTPSEFTKSELIKCAKSDFAHKIIVTPLAYDATKYNVQSPTLHILEKYKVKKPYLFFVGRLESKKNIENIIKSFKKLNRANLTLVLAGSPGVGFDEAWRKLPNVKFLGYVPTVIYPALCARQRYFYTQAFMKDLEFLF